MHFEHSRCACLQQPHSAALCDFTVKVVCSCSSTLTANTGRLQAAVAYKRCFYFLHLQFMFFISDCFDENQLMHFQTERYVSGELCVDLVHNGEPYAAISVCLPKLQLAQDEFVFKTYGENTGLYQQLIDQSAFELVRMEPHALGMLPVCRLVDAQLA